MEDLTEVVAERLQRHHRTDALESAAGTAGTATDEHQGTEDDPGDMRPQRHIIVEHACSGHERHHMEQTAAYGGLQIIAWLEVEHGGDARCRQQ